MGKAPRIWISDSPPPDDFRTLVGFALPDPLEPRRGSEREEGDA